MPGPILRLTNGTDYIDLLNPNVNGMHVTDWRPRTPQNIGSFRESPLTGERKLVQYHFENATETFDHFGDAYTQDDLIAILQDTRRLLIRGLNYYVNNWINKPVWIEAKATNETETRYALVKFFQSPDDAFPYHEPFMSKTDRVISDEMALVLERGHWLSNQPGTGECATINNIQDWLYEGWVTNHTETSDFYSIIQLVNGNILAGTSSEVSRSTDNGASWSATTLSLGGIVYDMLQLSTGRVLAVTDSGLVFRSNNNGASFGSSFDTTIVPLYCIAESSDTGTVIVGGLGQLSRSTDNGATFTTVSGISVATNFTGLAYYDGRFYAAENADIWRSDDDGLTWSLSLQLGSLSLGVRLETLSNGSLLAAFSNINSDNIITFYALQGETVKQWAIISTYDPSDTSLDYNAGKFGYNNGNILYYPVYLSTRGANDTQILVSVNYGSSWKVERLSSSLDVSGMLIADDESVYAGETTNLIKKSSTTAEMGISDDCDGETYITNKQVLSNITDIKISDGGVFSSIFPITSYPQNLLPAVPANGDIVYFGTDTSNVINAGLFDNLVFDLAAITLTGSYTMIWEYWTGAWSSLTVTDNTTANGGDVFSNVGVCSVNWEIPSNWTTTTIDSVTGYWVRARITALSGTITPPKQQNRDIYSANGSFFEVTDILGDIPSLAEIKLINQSDRDGKSGNAPNLWSNRVICGLRSTSRGDDFRSFINLATYQNPAGITITAGTNATLTASTLSPANERIVYSAAIGDTSYVTRATITFDPLVVKEFYGDYHVFLRGYQSSGSSGDIRTRLKITSGSGGLSFYSNFSIFLQTTDNYEILDLGLLTFPVGQSVIVQTELGDIATIEIQALNNSGATRTVYYYDLILIPTDEWIGDFTDKTNSDNSIIGSQDSIKHLIDIDSIVNSRTTGRALVRQDDLVQSISSIYEWAANGETIWQANATQRLYVLSAAYGTNDAWIAKPDVCWSVQAFKNERYLSMRGNR